MVSKTMDDLPEPDTPVKMLILRLGMRNETFFRLFSRAPRISIYSWDTDCSFCHLTGILTQTPTHRRVGVGDVLTEGQICKELLRMIDEFSTEQVYYSDKFTSRLK